MRLFHKAIEVVGGEIEGPHIVISIVHGQLLVGWVEEFIVLVGREGVADDLMKLHSSVCRQLRAAGQLPVEPKRLG